MDRLTKAQLEFMNGYVPANIHDIYEYATGGGIHIKPSHEGRFTEYKKRTGKTTEEALHSPDPHVRQMANFARNASHWKHQEGGTATGQNDQIMQMIQMYAQYVAQQSGKDPNQVYQELMQQLQQLKPEEQQAAIKQIAEQVQALQQQSQGQQQAHAQGQEQENPQEQVQEQGQEEQTMAYGGQPKYPFGGMMQNYSAPFLQDNAFNRGAVNAAMVGSQSGTVPLLSSIDSSVTQGAAGILGAAKMLGASAAGISGLFGKNPQKNSAGYQKWFHDKSEKADNMTAPNFKSTINPTLNPGQAPKKDPFATNSYANWKPTIPKQNPSAPKSVVPATMQPTGSMFSNYNSSAPADVLAGKPQPYSSAPSVAPSAQSNFDFNNADVFQGMDPSTGRTANFINYNNQVYQVPGADSNKDMARLNFKNGIQNNTLTPMSNVPSSVLSYFNPQGSVPTQAYGGELPHAQYGVEYNHPGFVDGMGVGQEGYDYGYSNVQLPIMGGPQNTYDPAHPISGASTNNLFAQKPLPKYKPNFNTNSVNANKKTIVSGDQIAAQGIIGADAADFALGWFDNREKSKAEKARNAFNYSSDNPSLVQNPLATHGNYTTNVQAGADFYQPGKHTYVNDYGTGYMRNSKYGGQQQFASGGQYKVSHEQLLQLLRDGAEIEFL